MPYWSIYCLLCGGYIADALLECIPLEKRSTAAFRLLFDRQPGAALACPYCNSPFGFDVAGNPCTPAAGWPIFRFASALLELKRSSDGEGDDVTLEVWALRHRFTEPGSHNPFREYGYAEQAPPDETVA